MLRMSLVWIYNVEQRQINVALSDIRQRQNKVVNFNI